MSGKLRLGTRGSLLALWQAHWVKSELEARSPEIDVELVTIRTTGDRVVDQPLATIGGKGLFTKELDESLLSGEVDLAVHSLKDLPFALAQGIALTAVMERGDPRDAVVSNGQCLDEFPAGSRIGTSSLRRRAQLLARSPQLAVTDLRGNVDTRLRKLDAGEFDAIVLSTAGLERLGYEERISERLSPEVVVPAVGQGAVVVTSRSDDVQTAAAIAPLDHTETRVAVQAERALLGILEGNCQVPVGGYCVVQSGRLTLSGMVASPDGTRVIRAELSGSEPDELGRRLGHHLLASGGERILRDIRAHGT